MIRTTRLIHKDGLFELLQHKDVVKIQLSKSDNRSLKNPVLCRVDIYIGINFSDFHSIIGMCEMQAATHTWKNQSNKAFVTGIASAKHDGFLRFSHLDRLRKIEAEEGIHFGISHSIKTTVEPFTLLTKG